MSSSEFAVVPSALGARRRRRLPSILVVISLAWLVLVMVLAVIGPELAPHDPDDQDILVGVTQPGPDHLLGTDSLGRDIFSRVLAGTRSPVVGALCVALLAMVLSTSSGLVAGYMGGRTETWIMRSVDLALALPGLLVLIVVVGAFKGGLVLAVIVLGVLTAPPDIRVIRSVTLEERPRAYVEAARVMGLPPWKIMVSHVFPNILPIVVVNVCLNFTVGLVALAALSFLGLGVGPGAADWGRMLFENRELMIANAWAALAPALMIMLTSAAANLAGDWAYERFEAKGTAR